MADITFWKNQQDLVNLPYHTIARNFPREADNIN
jgi:hypothetical protein